MRRRKRARDAHRCPSLVGQIRAVNIKLDKSGGLTEALAMAREAERLGFSLMVGCMVATSLSMAPAMLLAQRARWSISTGRCLLARDREHGLRYRGQSRLSGDFRALG
jgi:L-alanine-DL-glutamate epimerase-like enolase superfamily enzyme